VRPKLPKSILPRRRYVLFRVEADSPLTLPELRGSLREALLSLFGSAGGSTLSVSLKLYNPKLGVGVLRTDSESLPAAITSLLFALRAVRPGSKLFILKVSGTIRRALAPIRYGNSK